jgi:hypothetical protein
LIAWRKRVTEEQRRKTLRPKKKGHLGSLKETMDDKEEQLAIL